MRMKMSNMLLMEALGRENKNTGGEAIFENNVWGFFKTDERLKATDPATMFTKQNKMKRNPPLIKRMSNCRTSEIKSSKTTQAGKADYPSPPKWLRTAFFFF